MHYKICSRLTRVSKLIKRKVQFKDEKVPASTYHLYVNMMLCLLNKFIQCLYGIFFFIIIIKRVFESAYAYLTNFTSSEVNKHLNLQ